MCRLKGFVAPGPGPGTYPTAGWVRDAGGLRVQGRRSWAAQAVARPIPRDKAGLSLRHEVTSGRRLAQGAQDVRRDRGHGATLNPGFVLRPDEGANGVEAERFDVGAVLATAVL